MSGPFTACAHYILWYTSGCIIHCTRVKTWGSFMFVYSTVESFSPFLPLAPHWSPIPLVNYLLGLCHFWYLLVPLVVEHRPSNLAMFCYLLSVIVLCIPSWAYSSWLCADNHIQADTCCYCQVDDYSSSRELKRSNQGNCSMTQMLVWLSLAFS